MTDLEMTQLCAGAMGIGIENTIIGGGPWSDRYDPLHDDAQAMALVKKFELRIDHNDAENWGVCKDHGFKRPPEQGWNPDLNRAIVECVAKMQAAKA